MYALICRPRYLRPGAISIHLPWSFLFLTINTLFTKMIALNVIRRWRNVNVKTSKPSKQEKVFERDLSGKILSEYITVLFIEGFFLGTF